MRKEGHIGHKVKQELCSDSRVVFFLCMCVVSFFFFNERDIPQQEHSSSTSVCISDNQTHAISDR